MDTAQALKEPTASDLRTVLSLKRRSERLHAIIPKAQPTYAELPERDKAWLRWKWIDDNVNLREAMEDPDALQLASFQTEHLLNPNMTHITVKSRQIGESWLFAAESVAECHLLPRHTAIFVSMNQDEAKEKIRYARHIWDSTRPRMKRNLLSDSFMHLEFDNGSRLISHPCRPVRGKAKACVYLDEFAHYQRDRDVYSAALPVLTKGGRLRIGSTPLGRAGMFWEIAEQQLRPYPQFTRQRVPWWTVRACCKNVAAATRVAQTMDVESLVRAYATDRIITLFESMILEDYEREYCLAFLEETTAFITWEEITQCEDQAGEMEDTSWVVRGMESARAAMQRLIQLVTSKVIHGQLYLGVDVGRTHDLTVITIAEKKGRKVFVRYMGILPTTPFEEQKQLLIDALQRLPIQRGMIDRNGIGMQLAEDLSTVYAQKSDGANFTAANKELWAVCAKLAFQRKHVLIPCNRELRNQIHSIQRKVTTANNVVYDVDANEKSGHADMLWSLALALYCATEGATDYMINLMSDQKREKTPFDAVQVPATEREVPTTGTVVTSKNPTDVLLRW